MKFKEGDVIKSIGDPSSEWQAKILDTTGGDYRVYFLQHIYPEQIGESAIFEGFTDAVDDGCEIDESHIVDKVLEKYLNEPAEIQPPEYGKST